MCHSRVVGLKTTPWDWELYVIRNSWCSMGLNILVLSVFYFSVYIIYKSDFTLGNTECKIRFINNVYREIKYR